MNGGDFTSENSSSDHSLTKGVMISNVSSNEYGSCLSGFPIIQFETIPTPSSFQPPTEFQDIDPNVENELSACPNSCDNPTISTTMLDHKRKQSFFQKLCCCKSFR